jgi:hypothetical protein
MLSSKKAAAETRVEKRILSTQVERENRKDWLRARRAKEVNEQEVKIEDDATRLQRQDQ